jgi:hypothetical protein
MCFELIGEDRYESLFYKLSVVEFSLFSTTMTLMACAFWSL